MIRPTNIWREKCGSQCLCGVIRCGLSWRHATLSQQQTNNEISQIQRETLETFAIGGSSSPPTTEVGPLLNESDVQGVSVNVTSPGTCVGTARKHQERNRKIRTLKIKTTKKYEKQQKKRIRFVKITKTQHNRKWSLAQRSIFNQSLNVTQRKILLKLTNGCFTHSPLVTSQARHDVTLIKLVNDFKY